MENRFRSGITFIFLTQSITISAIIITVVLTVAPLHFYFLQFLLLGPVAELPQLHQAAHDLAELQSPSPPPIQLGQVSATQNIEIVMWYFLKEKVLHFVRISSSNSLKCRHFLVSRFSKPNHTNQAKPKPTQPNWIKPSISKYLSKSAAQLLYGSVLVIQKSGRQVHNMDWIDMD